MKKLKHLIKRITILYKILKIIFHTLRYLNIIKPKYNTSNRIVFGDIETGDFLKKKILNSNFFLEFGSGNTTIFAKENKKFYFSIESDRSFYSFMKNKNVNIIFYSLGLVEFYSYPLFKKKFFQKFYQNKARKYGSKIFEKLNKDKKFPDLILVDGRYRVLCMLNIFKFLKENNLFNTCVILDDYKFRDYYHIVREYFEIKTVGRLGICSIKDTKINIDFKKVVENYTNDPR